jgi:AraC-like DNA-binding protein
MENEILNNINAMIHYYNHRICTPSWCITDDIINFVDLTYVVKGQSEYTINDTKYIVQSGDLLCIPKGSRRSAISCPENLMEAFCANVILRDVNGADQILPLPLICNIGQHRDIIALFNDLNYVWRLRDPGHILKARAIFLMIMHRYFQLILYQKDTSIMDKRIKKVMYYMSNHFKEPLTVRKMAELVNLSDMYFGNLFKQETGISFHKFLTSIRMNHAEDLLCGGEYKINEIADACGFSDVFYFSRQFKENRGFAPSKAISSGKSKKNK